MIMFVMPPALFSKECGRNGKTLSRLIFPANLIYGPGPRVISFLLNAQINSVRTPDMLKLWGYTSSAACKLCGVAQCTLHHLLVNCKFAREQGRYLWRHDSALQHIEQTLDDLIPVFNSRKPAVFAEVARRDFHANFVRAGEKRKDPCQRNPKRVSWSSLMIGSFWLTTIIKRSPFPRSLWPLLNALMWFFGLLVLVR